MHAPILAISGPFAWASCRPPKPKPTSSQRAAAAALCLKHGLSPESVGSIAEGIRVHGEEAIDGDIGANRMRPLG